MGRLKSTTIRIFFIVICLVSATSAEDIDIRLRPDLQRALNQYGGYIQSRKFDIMGPNSLVMRARAAQAAGGSGGKKDIFHLGADPAEVTANIAHDTVKVVEEILNCIDYKIDGFCWAPAFPTGIVVDTIRSYRWPVQFAELVLNEGSTGYIPRTVNKQAVNAADWTNYQLAAQVGADAINLALAGAQVQLGLRGIPIKFKPIVGDEKIQEIMDDYRDDTDLEDRTSNPNMGEFGGAIQEYHVGPNPAVKAFEATVASMPLLGACHYRATLTPYFSDWPIGNLFARVPSLAFTIFPQEAAGNIVRPMGCTAYNMDKGKTPKDMMIPYVYPGPKSAGCLPGNQGRIAPPRNIVKQIHYPVASEVAAVRGWATASKLFPWSYHPLDYKRDRFQWTRSEELAKKGCMKAGKFWKEYPPEANQDNKDDWWNVVFQWRKFRCCRYPKWVCAAEDCQKIFF